MPISQTPTKITRRNYYHGLNFIPNSPEPPDTVLSNASYQSCFYDEDQPYQPKQNQEKNSDFETKFFCTFKFHLIPFNIVFNVIAINLLPFIYKIQFRSFCFLKRVLATLQLFHQERICYMIYSVYIAPSFFVFHRSSFCAYTVISSPQQI